MLTAGWIWRAGAAATQATHQVHPLAPIGSPPEGSLLDWAHCARHCGRPSLELARLHLPPGRPDLILGHPLLPQLLLMHPAGPAQPLSCSKSTDDATLLAVSCTRDGRRRSSCNWQGQISTPFWHRASQPPPRQCMAGRLSIVHAPSLLAGLLAGLPAGLLEGLLAGSDSSTVLHC